MTELPSLGNPNPAPTSNPLLGYINEDGTVDRGKFFQELTGKIIQGYNPQDEYEKAVQELPGIRARTFKQFQGDNWYKQGAWLSANRKSGGKLNQLQEQYWMTYEQKHKQNAQARIRAEVEQRKQAMKAQIDQFDMYAAQYTQKKAREQAVKEETIAAGKIMRKEIIPRMADKLNEKTSPEQAMYTIRAILEPYGTNPAIGKAFLGLKPPTTEKEVPGFIRKLKAMSEEKDLDINEVPIYKAGKFYRTAYVKENETMDDHLGDGETTKKPRKDDGPKTDVLQLYDAVTGKESIKIDVERGKLPEVPDGHTRFAPEKKPTPDAARAMLIKLTESLSELQSTGNISSPGDGQLDKLLARHGLEVSESEMSEEDIAYVTELYEERIKYYESFVPKHGSSQGKGSTEGDATETPDWREYR